ncbi:MAG: PRC-barrel domain-containing protein [Ilumatobacteraceae bacterium]
MNVSELVGRPVLDLSTATTAGRIDDIVVDPASRCVAGFRLAKTSGPSTWLAWDNVAAVGADAVTIERPDLLTEEPNGSGRGVRSDKVLGGRLLTDEGRDVGPLADIEIDAESGAVRSLIVPTGRMAPEALLGIGSYATIVHDPR